VSFALTNSIAADAAVPFWDHAGAAIFDLTTKFAALFGERHRMGRMPRCHHCRSAAAVRRATPHRFDRMLVLLWLRPYRCEACGARFYRFAHRRRHKKAH
jgi:hypothetical protein